MDRNWAPCEQEVISPSWHADCIINSRFKVRDAVDRFGFNT